MLFYRKLAILVILLLTSLACALGGGQSVSQATSVPAQSKTGSPVHQRVVILETEITLSPEPTATAANTPTLTPTNTAVSPTSIPSPTIEPTALPTSPTPTLKTAPTLTLTPVPQKYQFTPSAWHADGNKGIVHFRGTIRDEGENPVNGYSVLIDNGSWSVLSHPSGASHHYPDKPDGEWDVVIPQVSTGVGWWWLTVVSYDCPDFETEFNAQCKQFTRLSEDIKIKVVWPDETIIWADWICHWDCDKGLYAQAYRRP
jgi:hypothetical protein